MHVVVPIFQKETSEVLKASVRDQWIAWAGPPEHLTVDPAKTNLGGPFVEFCENAGICFHQTAADAHWQLGKVERHGQWFARIFDRVCDEIRPTNQQEFVDCLIQTQTAKNSLLSQRGVSPYQLVFGRNPRVPEDLLQENPHVAASDAVECSEPFGKSHEIRQAARRAVLACQDDKALRAALRARPRVTAEFQSGDWVFYWRTQKWQSGVLERGGRWYGAAMVLGKIGRNLIVAHRRNLLRCAPEQVRHAAPDERVVAEFPESELLGIKNLLERGQFPRSQFTDIVGQSLPPDPEQPIRAIQETAGPQSVAELYQHQHAPASEMPIPNASSNPGETVEDNAMNPSGEAESTYGPVRRRYSSKQPQDEYTRPPVMKHEDFQEMMQELIPQLMQGNSSSSNAEAATSSTSPRGTSQKREASNEASGHTSNKLKTKDDLEDLFCEEVLLACSQDIPTVEVLMSAFLQKRMQKELPPSNNAPDLQEKIDAAKLTEWTTLSEKPAIKVWKGVRAQNIRERHADRFIGSRFVIVEKTEDQNTKIKARWCLQGHLDPDFNAKISSGLCHSPTLSQLARSLVLQILASKKWVLCLGDVKGAFLEAGELHPKFRPLYAKQPQGGIPGVDPNDVIEVLGNVYGANDAPLNWYNTFDEAVRSIGFERSQFDNCLYFLRDPKNQNELCAVLGAHVDDTIIGGSGKAYEDAVKALRARFPYRKWRVGHGEFCGVQYSQNPQTYEITYHQSEYAKHLRPICISKERAKQKQAPATDREIAALRAINGAANWLSSQTRPDLCVQTSLSQQCFPRPKVQDLIFANQLVHRARQYSHVAITVRSIPWDKLGICFHSDAGFANAKGNATQAGYILGFVDDQLEVNQPSLWSPFCWKSFKMPRVVSSTLGAEAQSFSTASALAEWMALMITEAKQGAFDLRAVRELPMTPIVSNLSPKTESITGITDCKSLYDHLTSMSSVSKVEDKRVAIDLAILKQCMARTGLSVRWCPTQLQIADGLTKDQMDPADLLRAALDVGEYQLNQEATILALKKQQREETKARQKASGPPKGSSV